MNPLNQLPIDPAMLEAVDKAAQELSARWGATVVLIVAEPDKKLMVTSAGEDLTIPGQMVKDDVHTFFQLLAMIGRASEAIEKGNAQ